MIAPYKPGESPPPSSPPGVEEPLSPRHRRFIWIFSVFMVVIAGTAFLGKLFEFIYIATSTGSQALASFLIPVLNYLMVGTGFLFLFTWAYLSGQFKDVEHIKYRMLEMQDEIDGKKRPAAKK